jgi:hypothetical protein
LFSTSGQPAKTKFTKFFRTALADNSQIDNLHLGFLGTDCYNIELANNSTKHMDCRQLSEAEMQFFRAMLKMI